MSRTRLIDGAGQAIGMSPLFRRPPAFRNAIVQSIGGANTVVMNRAGFELFRRSTEEAAFVSHDWWAYLVISGAAGRVYYDPIPHIDYRQHGNNVVGRNTGFRAVLDRFRFMMAGGFNMWLTANLAGLDACRPLLSDDARTVMKELAEIRRAPPPKALMALSRSGIYRQTAIGNLALWLAVLLRRL